MAGEDGVFDPVRGRGGGAGGDTGGEGRDGVREGVMLRVMGLAGRMGEGAWHCAVFGDYAWVVQHTFEKYA